MMPKLPSSGPRIDPLAALCNEVSKLVLSWRRALNAGLLQFLCLVLRACTEIVLSPPPWHALRASMCGLYLRTVTVQWAARASLHAIVSSDVLPCLCDNQVGKEAASSVAHFHVCTYSRAPALSLQELLGWALKHRPPPQACCGGLSCQSRPSCSSLLHAAHSRNSCNVLRSWTVDIQEV